MNDLPFSQAAQNNAGAILSQLRERLADLNSVLELGAGTGQHAVTFARAMPHVTWQPTEHPGALPSLIPRCAAAGLDNLATPVAMDISQRPWSLPPGLQLWPDLVYTANTLHIVGRDIVQTLFAACADQASSGSLLLVYGPFNYGGVYTSPSNERFDAWLRERDPRSGIRDQAWVNGLAAEAGYDLEDDVAMPANNRLLCWVRR